jgi:hypothetical protein
MPTTTPSRKTTTISTTPHSAPYRPGDLLLFEGSGLLSTLIRWAQSRRPSLAPYQRITHCAIAVSGQRIVEAVTPRVRERTLEPTDHPIVHCPVLTEAQREAIVAYATAQIGKRYGTGDALLLGVRMATGIILPWQDLDDVFCSQVCLRSLQAGGLLPHLDPSDCAPATLAWALTIPLMATG